MSKNLALRTLIQGVKKPTASQNLSTEIAGDILVTLKCSDQLLPLLWVRSEVVQLIGLTYPLYKSIQNHYKEENAKFDVSWILQNNCKIKMDISQEVIFVINCCAFLLVAAAGVLLWW